MSQSHFLFTPVFALVFVPQNIHHCLEFLLNHVFNSLTKKCISHKTCYWKTSYHYFWELATGKKLPFTLRSKLRCQLPGQPILGLETSTGWAHLLLLIFIEITKIIFTSVFTVDIQTLQQSKKITLIHGRLWPNTQTWRWPCFVIVFFKG